MEHLTDGVDEMVEFWTLLDEDRVLLEGRRGATALGFALLLKHYSRCGRFPRGRAELPDRVVEFVARQVAVPAADLGSYEWSGSTIEYHRSQIRAHLGFRVATINDQEKMTAEPRNLRRIKDEVRRRWGTVALIDILKEAVLRTGCLNQVSAVAGSGTLPVEVLSERLMLAIYAYGTNTGIRSVAAGGGHGHSEDEIRYVRRRYLTRDTAAAVAIGIANATFAARQQAVWGEGSTAVASDSTHFRSYDQNIFTEWHSRYGGRGILIYWHVDRGSMVVHSQTLRASASEVHAMVEGAIRHGTTMKVEGNYVDTHGQSEIGFGITRLLGFDLLPRIKQINRVRLYRPEAGQPDAYPHLTPALTRSIRWDLVEENYDQMIKYATAIRQGTASTEAILSRFTRSASHPTYQAMLEVGRAQRTIFVARYLRSRELQREITEGLNVVEAFNGANSVIYYGKGGEIASNRKEEQEMTVLCLRILQAALVYVNTLLLQDVLAEDAWADMLTAEDRRGLTPLFWQHVLPYGEVKLDMTARLSIKTTPPNAPSASEIEGP